MELYNAEQQAVLNKLNQNRPLTLDEVKVIVDDVNKYKISKPQGIDIDTKDYCLDRQLVNEYISRKYSDDISYFDKYGNIHKLYF